MDIKTALRSLIMIGIVAALVGGATYAVFSDTETSIDNEMVAGTIDMKVDGENPWTDTTWADELHDMKPCYERTGSFVITNVGTNEMDIWKKLTVLDLTSVVADGIMSEPECVECGGSWGSEVCSGNYEAMCDLAPVIEYGMTVEATGTGSFAAASGEPVVYTLGGTANQDLADVSGKYIYLGRLFPAGTMTVTQLYHMEGDVGNWAQGDLLMFDVELYGEQVGGSALGPPK